MKLPQISTQWIDQVDGLCKLQFAGCRSLKCGKSWIAFVFCCFTLMRHRKKKSGSWDFRKCIGNNLTLRTKFMFHCRAFFCYNYTLFSTDGNVSIQLDKIKSHKRPVHLLTLTFNFSLRILQSYDSKTFSLLFLKYMGFLTRSIIYATRTQLLTYLLQIIQIHFQKSQLPFFFSFALSCKCETTKQKGYPTPSTFEWNPDLQPAVYMHRPPSRSIHVFAVVVVSFLCNPSLIWKTH